MAQIEREMLAAARALEFERAASLRDRLEELATQALAAGAIDVEEASRALPQGRIARAEVRKEAPRPRGRGARNADGRPLGAEGTPVRTEKAGPDVVPGEDPVRRRARGPRPLVPTRLKRKLR